VLDTAALHRVLKKESQNRSLANVLADLGRSRWNFHNAGNDARYTLEALVALVIQARLNDDDVHAKDAAMASLLEKGNNETGWGQEKMERVEKKDDDPTRQAQEECEALEKAGAKETTRTLTSPNVGWVSRGVDQTGVFATSLPILPKARDHCDKGSDKNSLG